MEFKIRVARSGTVWLDKIDPMTDKVVTEFCLWDSRSALLAPVSSGQEYAKNLAEFTGFEIVTGL